MALIVVAFGTAEARQGPGFDCRKAHHPLAQLICDDDELSQVDLYLNQAYNAYRDTLDAAGKKRLAHDENVFIRAVINLCSIPSELSQGVLNDGGDDVYNAKQCIEKAERVAGFGDAGFRPRSLEYATGSRRSPQVVASTLTWGV
jgi:hypothetical protein